MIPLIIILLLILCLGGLCVIVVFGTRFMLKAQTEMEVDKSERQRAISWSAAGSICSGISFGLMCFILAMISPEIEISILTRVLTALLCGFGMTIGLFGVVLLSFAYFEGIALPARRKVKSRWPPEEDN